MTTPTPVTLHCGSKGEWFFRMADLPMRDLGVLDLHVMVGFDLDHPDRARDAKSLYEKYSYHPDVVTLYGNTLIEAGKVDAGVAVLRKGYGGLTALLIKHKVEKTLSDRDVANRPYARLAQHFLIQIMDYAVTLPREEGRSYYRLGIKVVREIQSFIPNGRINYGYWITVANVGLGNFKKVIADFERKGSNREPYDRLTYAWAQFEKGDYLEGDASLRRCVGLIPGHVAALLLRKDDVPAYDSSIAFSEGDWSSALRYEHYMGAAWRRSPKAMTHLRRYRALLAQMLSVRIAEPDRNNDFLDGIAEEFIDPSVQRDLGPFMIVGQKTLFARLHHHFGVEHPDHFDLCEVLRDLPHDVIEGFHALDDVMERLPNDQVDDVKALKALKADLRKSSILSDTP